MNYITREGLSWKGLLPSPTLKQRQQMWLWKKYPNWSTNVLLQVHIFCVVREQPGGVDGKERLKRALQSFKILPQTNDRQQMTEEERYVDYGFEHRVSFVKGTLYGVSTLSSRTIFLWSVEQNPQLHWLFFTTPHDWIRKLVSSFQPIECKTWTNRFLVNRVSLRWR